MLHKNRIVDIGGDDTAFLSWIAEEDLDNAETAEAENVYNVTEFRKKV